VSEPTYAFTLTETERAAFAKVLGGLVTKLLNAPVQIEEKPNGGTQQARAVLSPPSTPPAVAQSNPQAPIALRDRWARDRKGNEVPNPEGCEALTVRIWKQERKDLSDGRPRLKVAWQSPSISKGFGDANCFDEKLFPWIAAQSKEATATLYVVKNGKYLNVVGVRA